MVTEIEEPIGADATPEERRAKHLSRVDSLLDHAGELLQKSRMTGADRLQVSEKIWGSVTHTLKAIAATRGWVFHTARATDSFRAYLRNQSGDRRINELFGSVHSLHINFYEDRYSKTFLRDSVDTARELNQRLWEAADSIPPDADPPNGLIVSDSPHADG